ncbi:hypothetical protein Val02_15930 [Virgisporangium aliadipatigenens]|uniref:Uncharacterized protein n=1 Tax=Virgisporangium aliadipatigenens TaxID=741659 RepID=A0A8J3YI29_9ACTN|nr:hypothetical protein [Virgisporangium aliadipatigenens]GIJ44707.1 hypothetical protein Val02_15930 [Virgisporangium aliadipatigenens]
MTNGTGPRRRRWAEPPATDPAEDDWLAGLRPSDEEPDDGLASPRGRFGGGSDDMDDDFAAPPRARRSAPVSPAPTGAGRWGRPAEPDDDPLPSAAARFGADPARGGEPTANLPRIADGPTRGRVNGNGNGATPPPAGGGFGGPPGPRPPASPPGGFGGTPAQSGPRPPASPPGGFGGAPAPGARPPAAPPGSFGGAAAQPRTAPPSSGGFGGAPAQPRSTPPAGRPAAMPSRSANPAPPPGGFGTSSSLPTRTSGATAPPGGYPDPGAPPGGSFNGFAAANMPSASPTAPPSGPDLDETSRGIPRRPSVPAPLPDEQPIFQRIEPLAPGEAPPPPTEEPILRFIDPSERDARTQRRAAAGGGRRRAPEPPEQVRPVPGGAVPGVGAPGGALPGGEPSEQTGGFSRPRNREAASFTPGFEDATAVYAPVEGPGRRYRDEDEQGPAWQGGDPRFNETRYDDEPRTATLPRVAPEPRYDDEPRFDEPAFNDRYNEPRVYGDLPRGGDRLDERPRFDDPRFDEPDPRDPRGGDPRFDDRPRSEPPRAAAAGTGTRARKEEAPGNAMRTVRPDTTGGIPRITGPTTGSIPRVGGGGGGGTGPIRVDPVTPGKKQRSRWLAALSTIGVLVLLAVCGLSTYFVYNESSDSGNESQAPGITTPEAGDGRDISSRDVDPAPLTEDEVFPGTQVAATTGGGGYEVLKKEASTDCGKAASEDLGKLLIAQGCNQVVRATLKTGDGAYLITAGIFNLKDAASAVNAHENIKPTIDAQKGRFNGLLAGTGTDALVRAPMILGWHAKGHFLAYCIIARTDAKAFEANDANPPAIQNDILTAHLRDGIIGGRATNKGTPAPASS